MLKCAIICNSTVNPDAIVHDHSCDTYALFLLIVLFSCFSSLRRFTND